MSFQNKAHAIFTLANMTDVCVAKVHGSDQSFLQINTDTRTVAQGELFVAIRGINFDGHGFVQDAKAAGAVAAVVDKAYIETLSEQTLSELCKGFSLFEVEDTLLAYGTMASEYAQSLSAKRIAITGSCGKTTVKEMVTSILAELGQVHSTKGNFNNEVGVPKTLLLGSEDDDYSVVEMGANHLGEIAYLSSLVEADVVAILNADRSHLEGFGSLDGVVKAKGEIYLGAKSTAKAVLNIDDVNADYWRSLIDAEGLSVISCSDHDTSADIHLLEQRDDNGLTHLKVSVAGKVCSFSLALLGQHNIKNALMSLALVSALGIDAESMVVGLARTKAVKGRLFAEKISESVLVIDDTYNANPLSVSAAIDVLAQSKNEKVLVMGDMGELGEESENLHKEIGELARDKGINFVYGLGPLSKIIVSAFDGKGAAFSDRQNLVDTLVKHVDENAQGGNKPLSILFKGSRSAAMDKVLVALKEKVKEAA